MPTSTTGREAGQAGADAPVRLAVAPLAAEPTVPPSASPPLPDASAVAELAWLEVERRTSLVLVVVAVLSAIVAIAVGLLLAEALIRPLRTLRSASAEIAAGDLARRSGVADRRDEIGDLGRSFDTMAAALQEAQAARQRFLQDAAHELGTPVTAIQTTASAILDGVWEPEARHIETIRDQARLLARIADDLRTIALAEVRELPMAHVEVDLASVATSTAAAFAAAAVAGGRTVSAVAPGPVLVIGDADRLRQVVGALVDNALRHVGPGGWVRVQVGLTGEHASVAVEDDGPGLGPHPMRVFARFHRGDVPGDRREGHAGLGLAIVEALVTAHGGTVRAANRSEGGARFTVTLPAAGGPAAAVTAVRGAHALTGGEVPDARA